MSEPEAREWTPDADAIIARAKRAAGALLDDGLAIWERDCDKGGRNDS